MQKIIHHRKKEGEEYNMKKILVVLAVLLAVTYTAKADLDTVVVGGGIEIRGVYLDDMDYTPLTADQSGNWYESITKVSVAAEFTDNVSSMIQLLNDRNWSNDAATATQTIDIDLAYIKIADMFGYPITATLGRQNIKIGEGFLIADGTLGGNNITSGGFQRLDPRKAFDALRFTYAEEPYSIDLVIAKAGEGPSVYNEDDNTLIGLNVNYVIRDVCVLDIGLWNHKDDTVAANMNMDVIALAVRAEGQIPTVPGLTAKAEIVHQFGDATATVDKDALGYYLGVEYALDNDYKTWVALTYIVRSGNDTTSADNETFDVMFQDINLGDMQDANLDTAAGVVANGCKVIKLTGGFKPVEKVTVDIAYYNISLDEVPAGTSDDWTNDYTINVTYDYSEDVQLGLLAAYSDPDTIAGTESATAVVASVKVNF
jgi:hypothetical protein